MNLVKTIKMQEIDKMKQEVVPVPQKYSTPIKTYKDDKVAAA